MPQSLHPAHQFFLQTTVALVRIGITVRGGPAQEFCEGELREFEAPLDIFGFTFIVNGKLFAGFDAVRRISRKFAPQGRCAVAIAAAFGHQREFPRGAGPEFRREPRVESLDTCGVSAFVIASPLQEFG